MSWSSRFAHRVMAHDPSLASGVVACARTMSDAPIAIVVNGEERQLPAGTTVLALLELLGLGGRKVAVERNREIVPRAHHPECVLADGDRLELVTFVGGG
jgi:sulfur carrier protein